MEILQVIKELKAIKEYLDTIADMAKYLDHEDDSYWRQQSETIVNAIEYLYQYEDLMH